MKGRKPIEVHTADRGAITIKPAQISQLSEREAKAFARRHKLVLETERELAALLEVTWQDGCAAEKAQSFLEGIADAVRSGL